MAISMLQKKTDGIFKDVSHAPFFPNPFKNVIFKSFISFWSKSVKFVFIMCFFFFCYYNFCSFHMERQRDKPLGNICSPQDLFHSAELSALTAVSLPLTGTCEVFIVWNLSGQTCEKTPCPLVIIMHWVPRHDRHPYTCFVNSIY